MEFCRAVGLSRKPLPMASPSLPCRTPGGAVRIDYNVNGTHQSCASVLFPGTAEKVKPTQRARQHSAAPEAWDHWLKFRKWDQLCAHGQQRQGFMRLLAFWKEGHKSWFSEGDGGGLCRRQPLLPWASSWEEICCRRRGLPVCSALC